MSHIYNVEENLGFVRVNSDVRFPAKDLGKICPLLYEIVQFLEKWSPESYEGYYLGCALALISIISAGRVRFLLRNQRSTNLYIVLVGETGLSVKTEVMNITRDILHGVGLDYLLIPDKITAQKFFHELCITVPDNYLQGDEDTKAKIANYVQKTQAFNGQRGWIHDELGGLFREMMQSRNTNAAFREILRQLYDNRSTLRNDTVGRGLETARHPYLTILGAMPPANLSPHASKGSALWQDGLLARMVFICPPHDFEKNQPFPKGEMIVPESMISGLKAWHARLGNPTIKISPELEFIPAKGEVFDLSPIIEERYYGYRKDLKELIKNLPQTDLAGNYIRFPEIALKIATTVTSLSGRNQISVDDWDFAQSLTDEWRLNLHRLYYVSLESRQTSNHKNTSALRQRIREILLERGSMTSREIQQQTRFTVDLVDPILYSMVDSRELQCYQDGKTKYFRLSDGGEDYSVPM